MAQPCDLVLPCRDEAPALLSVLAVLPDNVRAIVVDNGSTDDTSAVAQRLGAIVVHEPKPGYGAAVHAGVLASTADIVAVMDGDDSMDAGDLRPLIDDVATGRVDLAVGRRRPAGPGAWPWHARMGNQAVSWWLRRRTGIDVHDIGPMRVFRRDAMIALGVEDRRSGYPLELLVRASAAGWVVREHDIVYRPRAIGTRSKVTGSVLGTMRAVRDFARALP